MFGENICIGERVGKEKRRGLMNGDNMRQGVIMEKSS